MASLTRAPAGLPGITQVVLLSGRQEARFFTDILQAHNPQLAVLPVHDRDSVVAACAAAGPTTRLISVCSSVIVPGSALAALSGPSYNFHPGPPSRPGRYPSVFALYDNDTRFGVTVHEMIATVDAGPIVAVHWFPIPPEASLGALEQLTFRQLVHTFRALAPHLALDPEPLARTADRWSGPKTTRAQADALAQITPAMDEVEVARRRRACGHVVTV